MELAAFGRALRKNWWLTLAITIIITAATAAIAYTLTPKYQSSVTFFVATGGQTNGNVLQDSQFAQIRVNSYISLVSSDDVAQAIVDDKDGGRVNLSVDSVSGELAASTPTNTVLLTVTATDPNKKRALLIAQKVQKLFPDIVQNVESSSPKTSTILHVTSKASVLNSPVSPRKGLLIGLGLVIGLALGLAVAFLRGLLDKSLRTAEDVRDLGLSPVGDIGYDRALRTRPLLVPGDPSQAVRAEQYRKIRTNLRFTAHDSPSQVIAVTSAIAEEGKSSTAANLAIVIAEAESDVVLVEADLRRPRVSEYLGLEAAVGLSNVLVGEVPLERALQRWGNLTVLPCGTLPPNPAELLVGNRMRETMTDLRARFAVVIIDTPPLVPVTDGAVIAEYCDGVLLVVRHAKTSRTHVRAAVESLSAVGSRVLGVVFTMRKKAEGGRKGADAQRYASAIKARPAVQRDDRSAGKPGKAGRTKQQSSSR